MGSKVVSTKLTEEEYGKLVGLCSASGYTVSKLLKRAILERMNEESQKEIPKPKLVEEPKFTPRQVIDAEVITQKPQVRKTTGSEERFLYY